MLPEPVEHHCRIVPRRSAWYGGWSDLQNALKCDLVKLDVEQGKASYLAFRERWKKGLNMVRSRGLEPPHPYGYMHLTHARLPIPPRPRTPIIVNLLAHLPQADFEHSEAFRIMLSR